MKKIFLILTLIVILSLLSACASKMESVEAPAVGEFFAANEMPSGALPLMADQSAPEERSLEGESGGIGIVERIVLKNASLSIVVPDPANSMDRIIKMAERMGGFVVSSNLRKVTTDTGMEVPYAYITIRVPADLLTTAMDEIKGQVENPDSDVLSENISGQDVTAEYTDLQSRLTNLELSEKKLQEFLDEATKAEDWLVAFNRLTEIRGQIEVLKGQIKYYDESAAFSSISVDLQAQEAIKPVTVGRWEPKGVALDAVQALINAMKGITEVVIWLVLFILPVLVVIVGPIWLIVWLIRRSLKRRKTAGEPVVAKKENK
jgi:hypothetical protein